ncbi:MAG: DNA gyrase subunit A [bacterium]|nr:DNA gyrase subunit A [bacterium]
MSKVDPREITKELQESYLDYAMSVIVARALPDVRDGLKPVHRRVLWAMWDAGLTHLSKFRKSANVVGETMAKYHPHGDIAIYDTLVRLAQDFAMRYPLVQGQGNFGSVDGDSAAAMRYTEARLSKISEELLIDIEKETVDWVPNYDGTREEPKVLPAKLPNLLLNGSLGIAVGMTTSIPPHNLGELVDAILYLADNADATNDDLAKFIKGPDFPTGGIIFDEKAIKAAYASGRGGITTRAKAEIVEERKAKQFDIVITEIPYQVNKSELIKKIAELAQDKKIEGIRDLRDESDRDGMRIVIELKNDVPPQKILNQLYERTDLQKDFHLNVIALVDGIQPQLLSLKDILVEYLKYRKEVVKRRAQFDLKKAGERAHILEGLVKALDAIDRVISTIKKSKDREEAHANLVRLFKLSDVQATAILEMKLQTLAALERHKIEDELKEKLELIKELSLILKSPAKILKIIKDEIKELKDKYGGERRTRVVPAPIKAFSDEDLIPNEEAIVTYSHGGYVKRLPPNTFKNQRRGGKGLIGSEVAEEDFLSHFFSAKTHDNLLFFTDRGRVFQTKVYEIPAASRVSKGKAIHNFLELPPDENVSALINYSSKAASKEGSFLVMATKNGLIKKTQLDDFENIRRNGIIAIALKKGDSLKWVRLSSGLDQMILTTKLGQSIRFEERQIRSMGRNAAGVRAIRLRKDDAVAGFDIIKESDKPSSRVQAEGGQAKAEQRLLVVMTNGFAKQTPLKEYKTQRRGGSGIKTAKITPKTGQLVSAHVLTEEKEIFALSAKGQMIRTNLESVRTTGRAAQGVKIMNLKSGDRLAGTVII